jgi:DNA-binding FadR family transcriptional regulator
MVSNNIDPAEGLRHALTENLNSGKWLPGTKLPTERQLSEEYRIGRAVVRRVLGDLRNRGMITQTVGSGTFVSEQVQAAPVEKAQPVSSSVSPAHLMEARFLLEPAILELVVRNATSVDMQAIEDCCVRAEIATTFEEFEHWDGILHQAIADAAHNSFFHAVFELMTQVREQGEWGLLKKRSLTPERRTSYQHDHRILVNALKERDIETARKAAIDHLANVRRNLLGY